MRRLLILLFASCGPALCGYAGSILFQTVPSKAGASPTPQYSLIIDGTFPEYATVANGGNVVNTTTCGVNSIVCPADLVFTLDGGCSVTYSAWDVIAYSPTTGKLTVAIKIPILSNTHAVKIYGCAGNAGITSYQGGARGAAYDNNYLLALHMEETSGTLLHDSTVNANDAIKKAPDKPNPVGSGVLGAAQRFTGTAFSTNNDYADFQSPTPATAVWTAEFWVNAASFINVDSIFLQSSTGPPIEMLGFNWFPAGGLRYLNQYNATSPNPPILLGTGLFYCVAFVRNENTMNIYVNGIAGTPASGYSNVQEQFKGLGWDGGAGGLDSLNGVLDEVYLSNVARSPDYLLARYNNLSNPSTFYTAGTFTSTPVSPRSTTHANSQVNIFVF